MTEPDFNKFFDQMRELGSKPKTASDSAHFKLVDMLYTSHERIAELEAELESDKEDQGSCLQLMTMDNVRELTRVLGRGLDDDRWIEMIKGIRRVTKFGLKDAKEISDIIRAKRK